MRVEETVGTKGIGGFKDVELTSGDLECSVKLVGIIQELREGGLYENWQ